MILMIQNLGSKPKMSCKATTEVVMTSGFLYLMINAFIVQQHPPPGVQQAESFAANSDN